MRITTLLQWGYTVLIYRYYNALCNLVIWRHMDMLYKVLSTKDQLSRRYSASHYHWVHTVLMNWYYDSLWILALWRHCNVLWNLKHVRITTYDRLYMFILSILMHYEYRVHRKYVLYDLALVSGNCNRILSTLLNEKS